MHAEYCLRYNRIADISYHDIVVIHSLSVSYQPLHNTVVMISVTISWGKIGTRFSLGCRKQVSSVRFS